MTVGASQMVVLVFIRGYCMKQKFYGTNDSNKYVHVTFSSFYSVNIKLSAVEMRNLS